jgi:hypothetical protein
MAEHFRRLEEAERLLREVLHNVRPTLMEEIKHFLATKPPQSKSVA